MFLVFKLTKETRPLASPTIISDLRKLDILTLSLPHKFLHRRIEWTSDTRVVFVSSICLWIPFAYLLFSFAWGLKEVFRLFTTDRAEIPFMTLTTSEQNFYAMWYASMALVVTFGFVARPMFLLRLSPGAVAKRRRSGIATDLQNLSNLFLYLFFKLAVGYWAVGIILGANNYFDFYHHRHWMILIVLVLFGNQWLSVNRVFGRAGLKWMAVTFITIVFMSIVFSRFPVINFSLLDNMVAKREPSTYIRVDLPQGPSEAVSSNGIYRFHHTIRIGIGYPLKPNKAEPEIFINDFPFDSTWSKDVGQYIATRKMEYDEVDRDAIALQLSIDKNVQMSVVKKLKKNLSRSNIHQIFLTFESDPVRTYLSQRLYSYCDDYYSGRVDVPVDSIGMRPIFCSDAPILARPDLVIVARTKDVLANGTKMTCESVARRVRSIS